MVVVETTYGALPWHQVSRLARRVAPLRAWSTWLVWPILLVLIGLLWLGLILHHGPDPVNLTATVGAFVLAVVAVIGTPRYNNRHLYRRGRKAGMNDADTVSFRFDSEGLHYASPIERLWLHWSRLGRFVHLDGAAAVLIGPGREYLFFPADEVTMRAIEALRPDMAVQDGLPGPPRRSVPEEGGERRA